MTDEGVQIMPGEKEEGPTWCEADKLEREVMANELCGLIDKIDSKAGAVIAVDGDWGTGKTFIMKMLQEKLSANKVANIYLDAYETDYMEDPLITISSQIIAAQNPDAGQENPFKSSFLKLIWARIMKTGLRVAGLGVLEGVVDDYQQAPEESALEQDIKNSVGRIEFVAEFKNQLSEVAPSMTKVADDIKENKLVIIVDELDRCKPNYTLKMLEVMKHIFTAENIIFILSVNKKMLEKTIENTYGEVNAHQYLQKFISYSIGILAPNKTMSEGHVRGLAAESQLILNRDSLELLTHLLSQGGCYLRDVQKIIGNLAVYKMKYNEYFAQLQVYETYMACAYVINPAHFNALRTGMSTISPIEKFLQIEVEGLLQNATMSAQGSISGAILALRDHMVYLTVSDENINKEAGGNNAADIIHVGDNIFLNHEYSIRREDWIPFFADRIAALAPQR